MINFRLFGFPIQIQWMFWLICLFLGASAARTPGRDGLILLAMWIGVVLISILWHELGHGWAMKRYGGQNVNIVLHGFGGECRGLGRWTRTQDMIISFAGPLFSIILGAVVTAVFFKIAWVNIQGNLNLIPFVNLPIDNTNLIGQNKYLVEFVGAMIWVNFGWAVLNLFPIYPLDGGQIFNAYMANKKPSIVPIVGMVCAAALAIFGLVKLGSIWMAFLFGLLAYQNWQRSQGQQPNRFF